ncbi:MAG: LysR family transcriptional regulator [Ramlibacter sp.]|jgi:LysR family glycine cleavage system transcriptional activator|uniref:LysR substrate-binding domain-containing protein n=1 Tax=Ramlibacter sp. TaxID=1917967 RepID=UPI0026384D81|nr:LysR substrate-binding domain-containing protein [Ramlibacter sp.]MDB5751309.1 LysR family transcriptional regulator [Ramlibacter sp.]
MPILSPSLVELHAFLAVAEAGSFRKAGEQLCVTQGAVSRAVARLEEHLCVDVLERSGAGVRLTPAGVELRRRTGKHVAALEEAALQLRRQSDRMRLRLSAVPSLGNLWLMPRLEDFRQRHAQVEIEFRQYHHDEDYLRDDVDLWLALKAGPRQSWPRQVAARYLVGRDIVAVCAPGRADGIRTAAQLLAQPLLYHSNYRDNWALWAGAVGAELPPAWRGTGFDLVMNLIEAARSGMGVAVVQQCMVEADLASGRLVMPVAGSASTGRGYYLCQRRALGAHPAAELFARWVRAQAALSEPAAPAAKRA